MEYSNNELHISGVNIPNLVKTHGSPLYVYDIERITSQFKTMTSAFSIFPHKIHFACKALTSISIMRHLGKLGCGIDAVSVGEVQVSLKAGIKPENIIFTPSGPSKREIDMAYDLGLIITLDSLSALRYWGEKYADREACIRINPHVFAGGDEKISVAGIDSKFGISVDLMDELLDIVEQYGIKVTGLHIHTGSDISEDSDYFNAVDRLVTVSENFEHLKFLDFGSGFKLSYKNPNNPKDKTTDLVAYAQKLKLRWDLLKEKMNTEILFRFEPGKFLVGDAGYFITTCNAVKENPVKTFVSVDSGLNHLIRPMMYNKAYHKIANISNPEGELIKYDVVGYICETDTFGENRMLNEVREGDLIMFFNAGAYCYSMASNYNSHGRPAEVAVNQGKATLIRERENWDVVLMNQFDVEFEVEEETVEIDGKGKIIDIESGVEKEKVTIGA